MILRKNKKQKRPSLQVLALEWTNILIINMHILQTIVYPSSHPQLIFWFEFLTPLSTETSAASAQRSDIETPQAEYSFCV